MRSFFDNDEAFDRQAHEWGRDILVFEEPPRRLRRPRRGMLPSNKPWLNLMLLLLTIASTWLTWGPWYSPAIIAVLSAHEMGHYVTARRYGMAATLPFFIPFPYANPFGTLGAMIQLHSPFRDRRALFDVGAAGPLAGLVVTLAVILAGVLLDPSAARESAATAFLPHPQPLMLLLVYLVTGRWISGSEIILNPLLYAGWVGLFVTSLNLMPVGQLDGGHIFYAVFGRRGLKWMTGVIGLIGLLALFYHGWLLLFVLLLLFGRRHPSPLDEYTPLNRGRRRLAAVIMVIFLLTFTPFPFTF